MSTDPTIIRHWLGGLGTLTAGTMSNDEARAKAGAYASLMEDWPEWVFCKASLEHVARECKFFPAYSEVATHLGQWMRENRSPQKAIEADKPRNWNETDEVWYQYWFRRKSQNFGPVPNLSQPPGGLSWRDHVASLVREQSGKAWSRIVAEGHHMGAA